MNLQDMMKGRSIADEAWRLRNSVLAQSRHARMELDERGSAIWLMRIEAWDDLRREAYSQHYAFCDPTSQKTLFGLPVRITVDDSPDTPMLQLLMEPMMTPRKPLPRVPT